MHTHPIISRTFAFAFSEVFDVERYRVTQTENANANVREIALNLMRMHWNDDTTAEIGMSRYKNMPTSIH